MSFVPKLLINRMFKYFMMGAAVAAAAYYIPQKKTNPKEVLIIALTTATTMLVLDFFAPEISKSAYKGMGVGIGLNQVGFKEGFGEFDYSKCPQNEKEVGEAYVRKNGRPILARPDLSDDEKLKLIFQNMKNDLDNLYPPVTNWNDHPEIARRLKLCAGQ